MTALAATSGAPLGESGDRLAGLDGWRAISIVSVLAGHLLLVNAVIPGGNDLAGAFGMAIFFCPGFLITRFLLDRPERPFLIRRALRILPLAWLGSGDLAEKYLKRPLLIAVTFGLAHISTYRFENHFIDLGRRPTRRRPMQFQP